MIFLPFFMSENPIFNHFCPNLSKKCDNLNGPQNFFFWKESGGNPPPGKYFYCGTLETFTWTSVGQFLLSWGFTPLTSSNQNTLCPKSSTVWEKRFFWGDYPERPYGERHMSNFQIFSSFRILTTLILEVGKNFVEVGHFWNFIV